MLYKIERNPLCKKYRTRKSQKRTLHGNEERKKGVARQVGPVEEDLNEPGKCSLLVQGAGRGKKKNKKKQVRVRATITF